MTRKVRRRYGRPAVAVRQHMRTTDRADVDSDFRTLTQRFRALKPGESLYPWARTELAHASGVRRWVAKRDTSAIV